MAAERCMSKMCSAPHIAIFGRCYCKKPKGHDGRHDCLDEFALSERQTPTEREDQCWWQRLGAPPNGSKGAS